jgi:UDP-2,3-diacylglucosamine hydrolase
MLTKAEIVAVSDIHIRHPSDDRCALLIDLIRQCADVRVPCFALLGDIFDFCLGGGSYFRSKFQEVGAALEQLAANGTHVIFIEGNHEFSMADMNWQGVQFVSETSGNLGHVWTSPSGKRIGMSHGDLFNAPDSYLWFRKLIKSKATLYGVSKLPGVLMDTYALNHARASRSRDPYRRLDESEIFSDADNLAASHDADHMLFGHFHRPWTVPLRTISGRRENGLMLCMPSWDRPNLLVYDGENFHRAFLRKPGSIPDFKIAQPGS